jgi:hypothetical protein
MGDINQLINQADHDLLVRLVVDGLRRTLVHYGFWYAEVEHQLGQAEARRLEKGAWKGSSANQMRRLGKLLGFAVEEDGTPSKLRQMSRDELVELLRNLGINWLANDGIWFQAVENEHGMVDAKRCNDSCWTRFSPYEAERIKELLGLPAAGGIPALKKALAFRMYALINRQSIEDVDERTIIFRMNECRVQRARQRKGLPDYPCKSVGLVEYPYFARTIDPGIRTECLGCPPDPHPQEWFCAWKFTLEK